MYYYQRRDCEAACNVGDQTSAEKGEGKEEKKTRVWGAHFFRRPERESPSNRLPIDQATSGPPKRREKAEVRGVSTGKGTKEIARCPSRKAPKSNPETL